jgi:hypothetical protein
VATLIAVCVTTVLAQSRTDAPDGSLAALTAEVRQLRLAVEQVSRTQTQTQGLGVYLSVQQSRILQVANRLNAVQQDLDAATVRSQDLETRVATLTTELNRASEPQARAALEDQLRAFKAEGRHVDLELQQARSRESELTQALQLEESRWNDLISRLEQVLTR